MNKYAIWSNWNKRFPVSTSTNFNKLQEELKKLQKEYPKDSFTLSDYWGEWYNPEFETLEDYQEGRFEGMNIY